MRIAHIYSVGCTTHQVGVSLQLGHFGLVNIPMSGKFSAFMALSVRINPSNLSHTYIMSLLTLIDFRLDRVIFAKKT